MNVEPLQFRRRAFAAPGAFEQLKDNEIFRLLVSNIRDYAIFMLDADGYVKTWNEGAQQINGYSADEIIGKHFSTFYPPEVANRKHPEHELECARRDGSYEEEGWRVRKDGTRFWASVVITAIYEKSNLIGFAKVTRDLTERKKAETAQAESAKARQHLALMIESVRDYAIFMLDEHGNVMTWNEGAQRINGYSAKEIIGKNFSHFYTQESKDSHHPQRELEIAREKGKYEEEGWRVRKDGSLFWANVLITALFDNGQLVGFAKVTRDLTERKTAEQARERAYQQLKLANDELQKLAYSISHELQEPVQAITSYSKLLKSRYSERLGKDADEFLMRISRGATITAKLIDDLWTYARITKPGIEHVEVSTARILRQAKEELSSFISERQAQIIHEDMDKFPIVQASRDQLLYVFKELIVNAIKHNPEAKRPTVEIGVIRERNGWSFNFRDNGPGIDRFFAQQIFSLYQRLNKKPDETGTGMGLPICKKIIENQHRGRIGFENIKGGGSEFFFWLPS